MTAEGRVRWRDSLMTWPGLSVTLVLLPWQWSLRFWNDWDMTSSWSLWLGPLRIEWFANKPLFTLERVEPPAPAPDKQRFGCWDGACPIKTIHWKRAPGCIRLTDATPAPHASVSPEQAPTPAADSAHRGDQCTVEGFVVKLPARPCPTPHCVPVEAQSDMTQKEQR